MGTKARADEGGAVSDRGGIEEARAEGIRRLKASGLSEDDQQKLIELVDSLETWIKAVSENMDALADRTETLKELISIKGGVLADAVLGLAKLSERIERIEQWKAATFHSEREKQ